MTTIELGETDQLAVENDTVLPMQFEALRASYARSPSKLLWLAVLEYGLIEEDREWLLSPAESVGSFRWIVYHLGFDADAWQDRIRRRTMLRPGGRRRHG